jgi:hypothetical protein
VILGVGMRMINLLRPPAIPVLINSCAI